jgi:Zn-dependent protease
MFEGSIQRILLIAPPILLALTVHECAHAWVANRMGDPTAKMLGRITLNPLKHLDPVGTLAFFLSGMFGWARPVPVNPRYFKNISKGMMVVALAGPLSNIMLAIIFAIIHMVFLLLGPSLMAGMPAVSKPLDIMIVYSIQVNISLAIFNMIPVPPLDGSRVLSHLLPPDKAFAFSKIEPYGFYILIFLIMSGATQRIIFPIILRTTEILTGGGF